METCGTPVKKYIVNSATSTFRRGDRVKTPKKCFFADTEEQKEEEEEEEEDEMNMSTFLYDSMQAVSVIIII